MQPEKIEYALQVDEKTRKIYKTLETLGENLEKIEKEFEEQEKIKADEEKKNTT